MRVDLRGTSVANRISSRPSGTERAHSRWLCEKVSSSRRSTSASSPPSPSMALRAAAVTERKGGCERMTPARRRACRLRRLLRRHLVYFARLQIDADAVDLVEVGAGDAHE